MLAFSSIAHSGYMLIGMTVAQAGAYQGGQHLHEGITGLVFYIAVYTFGSLGSFAALTAMGRDGREIQGLDDLAGAGRSHSLAAACLAVFMFSLAGIPPLAGFWGKFTLFSAAVSFALQDNGMLSTWMIALAVCGALNAAIGAAYYLRVVGVMYFQSSTREPEPAQPGGALAATIACAVIVVVSGVWPASMMQGARLAELSVKAGLQQTAAVKTNHSAQLAAQPTR